MKELEFDEPLLNHRSQTDEESVHAIAMLTNSGNYASKGITEFDAGKTLRQQQLFCSYDGESR
jgi:hypothetical protein